MKVPVRESTEALYILRTLDILEGYKLLNRDKLLEVIEYLEALTVEFASLRKFICGVKESAK